METIRGWLRLSGSSYRNWEEMRNMMLAEKEGVNGVEWWRKRWSEQIKEYLDEWEQQTKTPRSTPTQPEQPSLIAAPSNPHCWRLYGGAAERDDHRRTVTSDCKSSSSWREQTKRWQKGRGGVKCRTVRARGTRLVWRPVARPLKLMHLSEVRRFQWTATWTEETCQFLHAATWSRRWKLCEKNSINSTLPGYINV